MTLFSLSCYLHQFSYRLQQLFLGIEGCLVIAFYHVPIFRTPFKIPIDICYQPAKQTDQCQTRQYQIVSFFLPQCFLFLTIFFSADNLFFFLLFFLYEVCIHFCKQSCLFYLFQSSVKLHPNLSVRIIYFYYFQFQKS